MTGADHEGPYRVVLPGDTPPHPRAGRGGNRQNAVLGFVALPATVIAAVTTVTAAAVTVVTAAAVTTGSASTTSSSTTTAASRANLIIVCTVRQRVQQMCTLERNKVYSTKYSRFRSSLVDDSYCTL